YRGYYYDTETGLYYLKARYYDPELGRFISPDDISFLNPETINGLNLYSYCQNNPIMLFDPDGHFVLSIFLISLGIGIAAGATLGGYTAIRNGADIWSGDFWIGVVTGALVGGAAGAIAGLGGAFLTGGLLSIAGKAVADLVSGASYDSFLDYLLDEWQNYALAFAVGGLLKGLPLGRSFLATAIRFGSDVLAQPLFNQFVNMGLKPGTPFSETSYFFSAITRGLTFGIKPNSEVISEMLKFALIKGIARGFLSGFINKFVLQ
ncbi:MAG: RHS repeat-associated core domain-containing protein, partial [Erysipelotrichaceae bacterium]|nr:RHS repeat-associated core domain-containing protein [Erysipelotrichaceae bacterium]